MCPTQLETLLRGYVSRRDWLTDWLLPQRHAVVVGCTLKRTLYITAHSTGLNDIGDQISTTVKHKLAVLFI
jgi:hypothetical protein